MNIVQYGVKRIRSKIYNFIKDIKTYLFNQKAYKIFKKESKENKPSLYLIMLKTYYDMGYNYYSTIGAKAGHIRLYVKNPSLKNKRFLELSCEEFKEHIKLLDGYSHISKAIEKTETLNLRKLFRGNT